LTRRSNPRDEVNVIVTGFGSTRQVNFGEQPQARLSKQLQQALIKVETDETYV